MSIPHQFVLKDYKDSWSSGPPWAKCLYCDKEDGLEDATTILLSKRHGSKGLTSIQNTDLLSPRAAVFHSSGYFPHIDSRGHRPFRSLPSRYRGGYISGQDLTHFAPHRGALHRRPTAYYPFPTGFAEPANPIPPFQFNPRAQYQDFRVENSRLNGSNQIWGPIPIQSPAVRTPILEGTLYRIMNTSHQAMNIDNRQPSRQLRLRGVTTPSSTASGFTSRIQPRTRPGI